MDDCVFCKIVRGEIPAAVLHDDESCLAFRDINPAAPQHVIIIPKEHIATLNDLSETTASIVGHIFRVAGKLATDLGISVSGYRIVANCNPEGGQEVFHVHFHLLGGRQMDWPPG